VPKWTAAHMDCGSPAAAFEQSLTSPSTGLICRDRLPLALSLEGRRSALGSFFVGAHHRCAPCPHYLRSLSSGLFSPVGNTPLTIAWIHCAVCAELPLVE